MKHTDERVVKHTDSSRAVLVHRQYNKLTTNCVFNRPYGRTATHFISFYDHLSLVYVAFKAALSKYNDPDIVRRAIATPTSAAHR